MGQMAEALRRAEARQRLGMPAQPDSLRADVAEELLRPRPRRPIVHAERETAINQPKNELQDALEATTQPSTAPPPSAAPTAAVPSIALSKLIVAWHDSESPTVERFRSLRTRLLNRTTQGTNRVIGVTSALPGEGKSVTAANLAVVMAELRHLRVLLIDGHFRNPGVGNLFSLPDADGLAHVFREARAWEDAIHPTPLRNLHVLPAGRIPANDASTLWGSPTASTVMGRLRQRFHVIIVDTPPALRSADACVIGRLCTDVIMVLKLHDTPEESAQRAAQLLHDNLVPMAGCLIIDDEASTVDHESKHRGRTTRPRSRKRSVRPSAQEVQ